MCEEQLAHRGAFVWLFGGTAMGVAGGGWGLTAMAYKKTLTSRLV